MEAAINTALELDPDLGEAHAGLGAMWRYKGNSQEAIAAFQKAIELAPGYATSYHWLAEHWRLDLNRPDRALPLIRKAQELDPLSPVINITVAETLADLGRHDEALAQIDHSIEISPAFASAYIVKSDLMAWSFGKLDQALQLSDYAVELDPHSLSACVGTARLLSHLGDDDRAIMNIERCLELGPMLGDADKALETLAQAVATGWRGNWRLLLGLRSLDSIRDDPRFIAQKLILERDMEAQLESYLSSRGIVYR